MNNMNAKSKKLVIISGSGNTIAWFRLDMLKDFLARSYEVFALAPEISNDAKQLLENEGIHFIKIDLVRKSLNIFDLINSIVKITIILRSIEPTIVFSYTHKAILASSFAAFCAKKKIISVAMISGIGHIFDANTLLQKIKKLFALTFLRVALKINKLVFFQNPDDQYLFQELNLVTNIKTIVVNGSGVNLNHFQPAELPDQPVFLSMARLLKSKGLIEYANAAKIAKAFNPNARFLLYGYPDDHSDSISEEEIQNSWFTKYGVEYMGFSTNPMQAISQCNVFVLLSYNEGTPRSVLEAMSMGRAILTTNVRGCRETVIDGVNGFLVPMKDSQETSKRMIELMNPVLRKNMGLESQAYCAQKFDVKAVNQKILAEVIGLTL
jgi:glycosyltransferase involved in cell wall biosynthesis